MLYIRAACASYGVCLSVTFVHCVENIRRRSVEWYNFQWPWVTPDVHFKVTSPLFDADYVSNGIYTYIYIYIHTIEASLVRLYTHPTHRCNFEWPWTTLSDLLKLLTTRSIARPICDSWVSCPLGWRLSIVERQLWAKWCSSDTRMTANGVE